MKKKDFNRKLTAIYRRSISLSVYSLFTIYINCLNGFSAHTHLVMTPQSEMQNIHNNKGMGT
jgi:hypothetical protein